MIDRVFGADTTTKEVYEKGAKDVALSVLAGKNGMKSPLLITTIYSIYLICVGGKLVNYPLVYTHTHTHTHTLNLDACYVIVATVFAYGQTSSGKTYTMRGITEYTTNDIFAYIEQVLHFDLSFMLTLL